MNTKFPVWLWLIGWVVTLGVVISGDILETTLEWVYFFAISLALWPVFLGFGIGDILRFVQ